MSLIRSWLYVSFAIGSTLFTGSLGRDASNDHSNYD